MRDTGYALRSWSFQPRPSKHENLDTYRSGNRLRNNVRIFVFRNGVVRCDASANQDGPEKRCANHADPATGRAGDGIVRTVRAG